MLPCNSHVGDIVSDGLNLETINCLAFQGWNLDKRRSDLSSSI